MSDYAVHKIFFIVALLVNIFGRAQNIGINTSNPQAKLDVRGNMRVGGMGSFLSYDSLSGKISLKNSRLFVSANQQLIQHSESSEGLYYNNAALEYRNQNGDPVFSANWGTGSGFFGANVGIGIMTPTSKLHIQEALSAVPDYFSNLTLESNANNYLGFHTPDNYESGILFHKPSQLLSGGIHYNKSILPDGLLFTTNNAGSLYINNTGNVGIGDFPNSRLHVSDGSSGVSSLTSGITLHGNDSRYFNIITPEANESGILFGNSTNAAAGGIVYNNFNNPNGLQFRTNGNATRMVITNTGYVGLGNLNPAFILDINGRMRIRSGGNSATSAGLWLNNSANSVTAFVGMEDDTHVGFYGNAGAGWKFSMNTNSGALKINGSEGQTGHVITSNGSGSPQWKSPTKSLYDNTVIKIQNANLIYTYPSGRKVIPNLEHTFTVTGNAKVLVNMNLSYYSTPCACTYPVMYIDIELNNVFVARFSESFSEGNDEIFKAGYLIPVTAGTHTVRIVLNYSSIDVAIYGSGTFPSNATYKIIQE